MNDGSSVFEKVILVLCFDDIRVTRFLYIIANLSQAEAYVHRIHDAIGCSSVLSKLVDSGPNPFFNLIFFGLGERGKCVMHPMHRVSV